MNRLVIGTFKDRSDANGAIVALLADGIERPQISLLMSDATRRREFAASGPLPKRRTPREVRIGVEEIDRLAVDSIMLGNVGVLAAGPIVDALVIAPMTHHTLNDALRAVAVLPAQAARVSEAVHRGGIVLAIDAPFGSATMLQATLDAMGDTELGLPIAVRVDDHPSITEDDDLDERWATAAVIFTPAVG